METEGLMFIEGLHWALTENQFNAAHASKSSLSLFLSIIQSINIYSPTSSS
jgi:hypothetical protein